MKRFILPIFLVLVFTLTACAPAQVNKGQFASQAIANTRVAPTGAAPTAVTGADSSDLARTDEQGAVVFQVTPLDLTNPTDTLDFDVAMNTHSVDLGIDLAPLSTLMTDTGLTLQATKWDAPGGCHHVDGTWNSRVAVFTTDGSRCIWIASRHCFGCKRNNMDCRRRK
jgi:hypothetical protein